MANFKNNSSDQGMFIPVSFEDQIIPGTIEYAIYDIVENHIDTFAPDKRYKNDYSGRKAYSPKTMIKILFLAYSKGILTSRRIERACKQNVLFMAISGNAQPDHSTIASFVSSMNSTVLDIFVDILLKCSQLDLIGGDVFAVDGCKISSNASKEYSGTFKELENKKEKLKKVLLDLTARHKSNDKLSEETFQKRVAKYESKIKKIDNFLTNNIPKPGKRRKEIKSNITDNESAKIKSGSGFIQGYNGIATVDAKSQVIVCAEAFGAGHEGQFLKKTVETVEKNLKKIGYKEGLKGKKFLADTNYFSEENCENLEIKEIEAYIPDPQFRKRDPRFPDDFPHGSKNRLYNKDRDFVYNIEENSYTCPAGKTLKFERRYNNESSSGRRYQAKENDCCYCELKTKCLSKNSHFRNISIVDVSKSKTYSEKMKNKIDSLYGRDMYSKRMGIVEPVFANITYHKKMNLFTLRTKAKVNVQWVLYCCVHNIGKIANIMPDIFYSLRYTAKF